MQIVLNPLRFVNKKSYNVYGIDNESFYEIK